MLLFIEIKHLFLKYKITKKPIFGHPWWLSGKNLPGNAGDGFNTWEGRIPDVATEQLSPCTTAIEPLAQ